MELRWWNFPLVFTLAAAVATPAFGQAVTATQASAYGGSESTESVPDLSGFWLHPLPGFEPLPSGPTALVNRSRRPNGTGDILKLAGDYTNPILNPAAVEVVKRHGELGLNGIGDPNPHTEALHVVERYRLLNSEAAKDGFARDAKEHNVAPGMRTPNDRGKYLQLQFTVEDKGVFTTPWTATMTYGSGGNDPANWLEQACAENILWYPGKDAD